MADAGHGVVEARLEVGECFRDQSHPAPRQVFAVEERDAGRFLPTVLKCSEANQQVVQRWCCSGNTNDAARLPQGHQCDLAQL